MAEADAVDRHPPRHQPGDAQLDYVAEQVRAFCFMPRVLVIGSNCFTGSHVVDELLDDPTLR